MEFVESSYSDEDISINDRYYINAKSLQIDVILQQKIQNRTY